MIRFKHENGISLVGAGPVNFQLFQPFVDSIPDLYCADGGLNHFNNIGRKINAVIGDLDSADMAKYDGKVAQSVQISGQNDTDFEKCLKCIDARFYLCVGFLGARMDHTLNNLSALTKFPHKPIFLMDDINVCFRLPKRLELKLPVATRFSLFPLTEARVQANGLKWPVTDLTLSPTGVISTSNETNASEVQLEKQSGDVIVISDARCTQTILDQVVPQISPA